MVSAFLSNLKLLPELQRMYAILYEKENILDMAKMFRHNCDKFVNLVYTRCLFSTNMIGNLLNSQDDWEKVTLSFLLANLRKVRAINIEIDVTNKIDHMFLLAFIEGKWYIFQSYIGLYTLRVFQVDIRKLLSTISRWTREGVNPDEWKAWFDAPIKARNKVIVHIFAVDRIFEKNVEYQMNEIIDEYRVFKSKKDNYILMNGLSCIL